MGMERQSPSIELFIIDQILGTLHRISFNSHSYIVWIDIHIFIIENT